MVTGLADPGANVIFGAVIDDAYDGEVHVTIIATGFTPSFEDNILAGKVRLLCEGVWREGFFDARGQRWGSLSGRLGFRGGGGSRHLGRL